VTGSRSTMALNRRTLLALGGGTVALAALPTFGPAMADPIFVDYPFQLGVAAGDPASDGFVIWTRLAPQPLERDHGMPAAVVPVRWEVASDEGFGTIVLKGDTLARPELGHAVHVEVTGLEPGRPYWYRFIAGTERSLAGRAKTLPAAGADVRRVRFISAGCQAYEDGLFTAWRDVAAADVDFVFCYGDYIYEGRSRRLRGSSGGPVETVRTHIGGETYSLDDYRQRYAQYKMDADLQAAHASAAWFPSWDDHEIHNNWVASIDQDPVPPEVFDLRRQSAAQAFYEHMPLRRRSFPRGPAVALYRQAAWGGLLDLSLLDTRQYRSDQPCGDRWKVNCPAIDNAEAEVLGREQEKWLFDRLSGSRARWKVMAQQVMMMDLDRDPGEPYAANLDSWGGYRAPRARLLRHLQERRIDGAIVLTGDEHQHYAGELHIDGRNPGPRPIATEFVATSISSGGDGMDQRPDMVEIQRVNPMLKFNNSQRGYLLCDVTPERWLSDFRVVDQVSTKGGKVTSRAKWAVMPGDPRLVAG
jgi:alkaline phosphatase D